MMQLLCLVKMHHEQPAISFLELFYPFHTEKMTEISKQQLRDWE